MQLYRQMLAIVGLLLLLVPGGITQAQPADLAITIQPESAPPGTEVTITGQGAPPNTSVQVLFAPFNDPAACRAGRGAESVAVVTTDADGTFSATHTAQRLSADQAGNTYLAQLSEGPVPRPNSNLECFTFGQQQDARYFPETNHTVSGEFLNYWQEQGGLAVFGYPLTDRLQEEGRDVQYFERQRFELHPENQPPYNILLGRLGAQLLERQGVDWRADREPTREPQCIWFDQTTQNVCNQGDGVGFRSYWSNNGLEFDGQPGTSYAESLALFGYPLTTAQVETNSSGDQVLTQWFERARFEWHPDNPAGSQVLLGRLGAELLQGGGEPQPQPEPPVFNQVQIYFIALGDAGQSGVEIGCNDSAVPVEVAIEPTTAPLTAALETLFSIDSREYGETGLYNAFYQSNIQLENATVENGLATINLSGDLQLGGACDNPRIEAQIEQTALQFPTVDEVDVFLNGQPLEDVLAGSA